MGCSGSKDKAPKEEKKGSAPDLNGDTTTTTGGAAPMKDSKKGDGKGKEKAPKKKGKLLQVLVAGYQQSGKSTFFKQLQIIHLNGWSEDAKKQLMVNLKSNIIQGMKEIIEAAQDQELEFDDSVSDAVTLFEEKNPFDEGAVDDEVVKQAKALWADKDVQGIWAVKDGLPNISCVNLDYIMTHIDRIVAPGAVPNDEDVLRTRNRTTGTVELEFCYENKQDFKFVDVGGQKSERRKWSQVIQNPDAVLYFTSLTDFDVPIMVDSKKTKLAESLEIWESVVKAPAFANSITILFLNKIDLFTDKLKKVDMTKTFADYKGGADAKEAARYIRNKFAEYLPAGPGRDSMQSHVTCALDTEQIRTVFNAMRSALTERALARIGF